jgi:Fe-S-cluster containining protein
MMSDFLNAKLETLSALYRDFKEQAAPFKTEQACAKGCAFCCAKAGSIDMTTLEAWQIKKQLETFSKSRLKTVNRAIRTNIQKREEKKINPCPFLMKNNACMIYKVRPFSCRRIYSLHVCDKENPPKVSRQAMALANTFLKDLQTLDDTGYSGHISFVLQMVNTPAFMDTYGTGGYNPKEIMVFGKSHGIIINKMVLSG